MIPPVQLHRASYSKSHLKKYKNFLNLLISLLRSDKIGLNPTKSGHF